MPYVHYIIQAVLFVIIHTESISSSDTFLPLFPDISHYKCTNSTITTTPYGILGSMMHVIGSCDSKNLQREQPVHNISILCQGVEVALNVNYNNIYSLFCLQITGGFSNEDVLLLAQVPSLEGFIQDAYVDLQDKYTVAEFPEFNNGYLDDNKGPLKLIIPIKGWSPTKNISFWLTDKGHGYLTSSIKMLMQISNTHHKILNHNMQAYISYGIHGLLKQNKLAIKTMPENLNDISGNIGKILLSDFSNTITPSITNNKIIHPQTTSNAATIFNTQAHYVSNANNNILIADSLKALAIGKGLISTWEKALTNFWHRPHPIDPTTNDNFFILQQMIIGGIQSYSAMIGLNASMGYKLLDTKTSMHSSILLSMTPYHNTPTFIVYISNLDNLDPSSLKGNIYQALLPINMGYIYSLHGEIKLQYKMLHNLVISCGIFLEYEGSINLYATDHDDTSADIAKSHDIIHMRSFLTSAISILSKTTSMYACVKVGIGYTII